MLLIRIGIWPTLGPPQWRVLPGPALTVGRDPACDLCLDDPAVSAFHARVKVTDQEIKISDLGSTNGTYVDGAKVRRATLPAPRQDHAEARASGPPQVAVGGYRLELRAVESAQAPEPEMEQLLFTLANGPPRPQLAQLAEAWAQERPALPAAARCLALARLRAGQVAEAAELVTQALAAEPGSKYGRLVAALAAEADGRLEQAAQWLEDLRAEGQAPPHAAAALRRVMRKREVYAKIKGLVSLEEGRGPAAPDQEAVLTAGPFRLIFSARGHGELVLGAHAALAQAADRLEDLLGFAPREIEVVFTDDAGQTDWAAACYDGAIRVNVPAAGGDPYFLYVALAHEYVHLAVAELGGPAVPAWLNEGLAQYITQNPTPADMEALVNALEADALLPVEALAGDFGRLEQRALVDLAYAQAYSLVQYLVERVGWPGVRQLLSELHQHRDQADPLSRALAPWGLDAGSLERAWLDWLK